MEKQVRANKKEVIEGMLEQIRRAPIQSFSIMEVCGTHTRAIYRYGIRQMVEPKIKLLSGPGCPVCVTSEEYIDAVIQLLQHPDVIILTFGDLMKVNGKHGNLIKQKEYGKDIRVVYSPLDAITFAEKNRGKEIVFLAVGFETTAPIIALAVRTARERNMRNLSFFIGLKRMEPVLHHILSSPFHNISGMIIPGHVAAVKGADYFRFVTDLYHIPAVVAGFEEFDIIEALYTLTLQQMAEVKEFKNQYQTCVTSGGNETANRLMEEIFDYNDGDWRGIGKIKNSEFIIRKKFQCYDAEYKFSIKKEIEIIKDKTYQDDDIVIKNDLKGSCSCGDILMGNKLPWECSCFGQECLPDHPVGPCMVSSEGSCAVAYQFRLGTWA